MSGDDKNLERQGGNGQGYRRVSIDIEATIAPSNRRHSVGPMLEAGLIQEIVDIHPNATSKEKEKEKEAEAEAFSAEEEGFEDAKGRAPLQPLDPVEGITIGLELLIKPTHLFIRQHTETEEVLFGVQSIARYDIMDESFNRMYYAWETESAGCGGSRAFTIRVADFSGRPVLIINRPFSWCNCLMETINCCGSYGSNVYITLPDGNRLGKIKQTYRGCTPTFSITDEFGNEIFTIKGPAGGDWGYGINMCLSEIAFPVYSTMEEQVGIITKSWPNLYGTQSQQNAEFFGVQMPKDIRPIFKSLLLGAVFTIDAMYFEHDASKKADPLLST